MGNGKVYYFAKVHANDQLVHTACILHLETERAMQTRANIVEDQVLPKALVHFTCIAYSQHISCIINILYTIF